MFFLILTDMLNHWFAQGAIPGCITKGIITLLKKGDRYVWENLDYSPITLLSTELKILAQVLANRLQFVISELIGPEQNYAGNGRSIQDNLHLARHVLEGFKHDTRALLIYLDQAKAFNRIHHWFLAMISETAGFKLEFHKWISWQGWPLSPLLYVFALEPFGMGRQIRPCRESPLPAVLWRRSLYTPMISPSLCPTDWT